MGLLQRVDALGAAHQAHQGDALAAAALDEVDGGDGGAAGGQHGIHHDQVALVHVGGQLAVVFHRQMGLRVAVQADVAHLRGGNDAQHAVHHAQACAQDRHDAQLLAGDDLGLALCNGRFDLDLLKRQIAGYFISHQHCNFLQELAEILGAALGLTHQSQFVLNEGMIHNMYGAHSITSIYKARRKRQHFCIRKIIPQRAPKYNIF